MIQVRPPRDNSAPPLNIGVDDIVNGMLLSKTLHSRFGRGMDAFIKV